MSSITKSHHLKTAHTVVNIAQCHDFTASFNLVADKQTRQQRAADGLRLGLYPTQNFVSRIEFGCSI